MEVPKGFEICFTCKEGANLIDPTAEPPPVRKNEFQGKKFVYKFSLKCNNCGEILHHFIPIPFIVNE